MTLTALLLTSITYVNAPIAVMREEPTQDSTVVSQAPFSEKVQVGKQSGDWVYITTSDGYNGWTKTENLTQRACAYDTDLKISRIAAHVYGIQDTEKGPLLTLPLGSRLQTIDASNSRWVKVALPDGREAFLQKGDVAETNTLVTKADLVKFSKQFRGIPYTWGGRSSFGFDCSGFIQMLYTQIGVHLQRDAKQQILDPHLKPSSFEELEQGDLVFFGKSEQKIQHVGLYIGNGRFIHATVRENMPWIRISSLSDPEWSGSNDVTYPYRTARKLAI